MATKNPRIQFVPSDVVHALVRRLAAASGQSRASIVSELMDDIAPVIQGQLEALEKIAARPDEVRAHVEALTASSEAQIAQLRMEFARSGVRGPDRKKRARRAARGAT
jgi:hypothetical protein